MRNVKFWGCDLELPEDDLLDEDVIHAFTAGQCHSLARALHRITGWPLVVLCYAADEYGSSCRDTGDHVVVQMPDGNMLDIEGISSFAEAKERWGYSRAPIVSESTVKALGWDAQNVRAARPFAEHLLAAIGYFDER